MDTRMMDKMVYKIGLTAQVEVGVICLLSNSRPMKHEIDPQPFSQF